MPSIRKPYRRYKSKRKVNYARKALPSLGKLILKHAELKNHGGNNTAHSV